MFDDSDPSHRHILGNVDLHEHRKQRLRDERLKNALLGGILIGIAAGLLWEAIRR